MNFLGCKRNSPIWDHFEYLQDIKKSKCMVETKKGVCGELLQGKNSSNLKTHLKSFHKDVFRVFEKADNERKIKQDISGKK